MRFDSGSFRVSMRVPTIAPLVFALLALIGGAIGAIISGDPHWMNRSGALIASFCALWVIYLLVVDINLGDARSEVAGHESQRDADPITDTAKKLARAQNIREISYAKVLRLRLALMNGVAGSIGELVHGFGDLAYPAVSWIPSLWLQA